MRMPDVLLVVALIVWASTTAEWSSWMLALVALAWTWEGHRHDRKAQGGAVASWRGSDITPTADDAQRRWESLQERRKEEGHDR